MYKILLTVDDAIARKNFQDQLELKLSGSEIIFTNDTHETTAFLAQNPVSLVVLDLHSFQVDSLNILALMTHEHHKTPCFILGDHTLLNTDTKSELYHYVQKPYDLEEVTSEIAHIIRDDVLETTPKGIPVATFMQLVSMEAKTCLLGVYPADGGDRGLFYFEKGILFDAVQSKLKGEDAALKMLSLNGAEIHIKDIQKKIGRKINNSLLALVERVGEPGPSPWEQESQAPAETPAETEPVEKIQEVEQALPEVDLEPIEEVETDEEQPLFASPENVDEETPQEPEPIARSIAEPEEKSIDEAETVDETQEVSEMPDIQEGPPILEPIEENPAEIAAEEVDEETPLAPADETEVSPEEPERPKTRDYFEDTASPQESKEIEAEIHEETVVEETEVEPVILESAAKEIKEEVAQTQDTQEEETPDQTVEEQSDPQEPERPKTIDYFEKVEAQKPQQEPETPPEAEPERPKTIDYDYVTEPPKTETQKAVAAPEPPQDVVAMKTVDESPESEEVEPVEDIVSILEAEPGEVDEEFEEVDEETGADDVLETLETLEEEEEREETVGPESPEPEPEILAEPIEEDIWEEPVETTEEEQEEVVSKIAEETKAEEKVSNETMEEVVAPIETAIQEEAPQPASEIETDPKTLWDNNIGDLRETRGYKAAAVLNFNGDVAVFDSVDPDIHLNTIGATFNSLFWLSQDAFNRVGLKEFNELTLTTPAGLVVMISSGKESPRQFHLIGILAEDGNQNLMRFKFGNLAQKLKNVPA